MTEPDPFDRRLDDFGARLSAASAVHAAGRRRARRSLTLAGGCAVAVAAVVAVVLSGGGGRLDAVAEARAALTPGGDILYMKSTTRVIDNNAHGGSAPQTTEQWSAVGPPRWRISQDVPRRAGRPPVKGHHENSYEHGTTRTYDSARDRMSVISGFSDRGSAARMPSLFGLGSAEPEADLRSMLADGTVTDEGEKQVGGRTVRRLVSRPRKSKRRPLRTLVYDVDPQTFAPIQATLSLTFPLTHPTRIAMRITVEAYRRIALDATSARLLEIPTTAHTSFRVRTVQQVRRDNARRRCEAPNALRVKRCPTQPHG